MIHKPYMMCEVTCSALDGGSLTLPEKLFVSPASDVRVTVPSMSFLIQHTNTKNGELTRILFDLGMRRNLKWYPQNLQKYLENRAPLNTRPDVVSCLREGGLTPDNIDYVIFSHLHYDHIGYPSDFKSPRTRFIVGPGSLALLDGSSPIGGIKHFFESDLLDLSRTVELPAPDVDVDVDTSSDSTPNANLSRASPMVEPEMGKIKIQTHWNSSLGPFSNAIDLFNDQSIFLFSAPGHLPGHLNMLVRTSMDSDRYVCLAGDACHDMRLFTGECEIAQWTDEATGLTRCAHHDLPTARRTIAGLAGFESDGVDIGGRHCSVEVIFAHNLSWEIEAKKGNKFFPGSI